MSLPAVIFVLVQTGAAADGGVSSISQIIAHLKHHRPIIVTDRESGRVDEWRRAGIETHVLPQTVSSGLLRAPLKALGSFGRYTSALRKIIRRSGARVVHANDPAAFQLSLPAVNFSKGVNIALNIRDTIDPDRRPPASRYRLLFGAADHVFYLSKDMADRWSEIAPNAKSACSVTYSIVDPQRFPAAAPHSGEVPPVVLISGLISPKKGQLEFVREVSPKLVEAGIQTWIVGDFDPSRNAYMAACADAAAAFGDSIRFLGYRTDLPELMARAAVIAVPSRYEGLVRAMIEAMSSARPVVSFDVCSAREILERESGGAGVVVNAGDYPVMTHAILRYCRDPALASSAGQKGRETAERLFAADMIVRRYEHVYETLGSMA